MIAVNFCSDLRLSHIAWAKEKNEVMLGLTEDCNSLPSGVFEKGFTYGHLRCGIGIGSGPQEYGAPFSFHLCDDLSVEETE